MPIEPLIPKKKIQFQECAKCGCTGTDNDFAHTYSLFYPSGLLPVCNDCINEFLRAGEYDWDLVDRLCQWAGIPFIVKEWVRLSDLNGVESTWPVYARVFAEECYEKLGWGDYHKQYQKLRQVGLIEDEIPLLKEENAKALRQKWGSNYDPEELEYLENLYKGLLNTQNVNSELQNDQAKKICKLSLEIDSRVRAGDKDVDKFLSSYDKLVKIAEFTPKNTKNAADFDSFAEVGLWLEKRGRPNKFYDGTTRDVIDETLKNIQNYNQRLYVNEGGIGEEITERIEALKNANEKEEQIFGLQQDYDLEAYDNEGFSAEEEEFELEIEEGGIDV